MMSHMEINNSSMENSDNFRCCCCCCSKHCDFYFIVFDSIRTELYAFMLNRLSDKSSKQRLFKLNVIKIKIKFATTTTTTTTAISKKKIARDFLLTQKLCLCQFLLGEKKKICYLCIRLYVFWA